MNDEARALIEARIAEMERDLAAYVEQANRQIAAQQGGIEALRQLLAVGQLEAPDEAEMIHALKEQEGHAA